jgi:hypothetical protein
MNGALSEVLLALQALPLMHLLPPHSTHSAGLICRLFDLEKVIFG